VFSNYNVLDHRELEARYEVLLEQYVMSLNIEGETAASIARTMILPAAARYVAALASTGIAELADEIKPIVSELHGAIQELERVNLAENQPDDDLPAWAAYMRDTVIPAMNAVREVSDRLEKLVADDLWPLPKYEEMLFIK
jgi:glutamine synthetase